MMQLIDENGRLDEDACESFLHESGAIEWNRNYGVISIMGPQSSGKSTLLNKCSKRRSKKWTNYRGKKIGFSEIHFFFSLNDDDSGFGFVFVARSR